MIFFVTNNVSKYRKVLNTEVFTDILVLSPEDGIELFFETFGHAKLLALDTETNGLDAYKNKILLTGIGTKQVQFVFTRDVDIAPILKHFVKYKVTVMGHNLQFDIRMLYTNYGVLLKRVFDTMIAEQRIWMRSGYKWGYADVVKRYLKLDVVKSVRNEFVGVDPDKFIASIAQVYYLREDLVHLFPIREIQRQYINRFKLNFLVYGIEFPLVSILAKAELRGFTFDTVKWLERWKLDKEMLFQLEVQMDEELRRLRETLPANKQALIKGGKYDHPRVYNPLQEIFKADGSTTVLDMFGEPMKASLLLGNKKKVKVYTNNLDWNNKSELVRIFAVFEQSMYNEKESLIPLKVAENGKLLGSIHQVSLKADILTAFVKTFPNNILANLLELKVRHSKVTKSITTYGENFTFKVNSVSGKIHTSFRQCFADTGRFQSGGGDQEPDKYNAQNIPGIKEMRECFTTNTKLYSITTADYSGAELIVMANHAQDLKLIELSKGDMHSHFATKGWRAIYKYRAGVMAQMNKPQEMQRWLDLSETFLVTKETKGLRTQFKPVLFGLIYGMYAKKLAKVLNIGVEEAKIVMGVVEREVPKTFAMVKEASANAERQGYIIIDERTNGRAWFPGLIKLLKGQVNKRDDYAQISEEMSAARNSRIQGCQATAIKEAIVVLDRYFEQHHIDARMLSTVHDELVVETPRWMDGWSNEWKEHMEKNPKWTLPYCSTTGKNYDNTRSLIDGIMVTVFNRYLNNVEIDVESSTGDSWTK